MGKNSRSTVVVKDRLGEGDDARPRLLAQGRVAPTDGR